MIKGSLFALLTILVLTSFQGKENPDPNEPTPDWLVGVWEMKTPRGSIYEAWTKVASGNYAGEGYTEDKGIKHIREHIQLMQRDGVYYYIPTVPDQNDGEPVPFTCTKISDTELIFENPEHDFPQTISYRLLAPNELLAQISGQFRGEEVTQEFPMTRVK